MPNSLAINMDFDAVSDPPGALLVDMDFVPPPDPIDVFTGGDVVVTFGGDVIICFRSINFTYNGETLDITDSCSNGFREVAENTAVMSVDFAVEGITKSDYVRAVALGGLILDNVSIAYPPVDGHYYGEVIFGNFLLSNYSESVPVDGVVTFSATLQSRGRIYYFHEVNSPAGLNIGDSNLSEILELIYG